MTPVQVPDHTPAHHTPARRARIPGHAVGDAGETATLHLLRANGDGPRPTDEDAATASGRADWVLAAPFRAHVRTILCETGLPWRALALLAGVPPQVVRSLVFGTPAGVLRRMRAVDAELLLQVDATQVLRLARMPVRPDALGARIGLLRRLTAGDDARIARWLHVPVEQLDMLAEGRGWCSWLTLLLAAAALSAHGVDGFWALQHLEGRPLLPGRDGTGADDDGRRRLPDPLQPADELLTHCAA